MPQQGGQCPFCQLIDNPGQLVTVGETENFYAWLEVNPRARGHTMVVPKEHTESVLDLSASEWSEAFRLTREVVEKARKGLGADGASVTVNIEEAGGQMLPHAYIQVFPRFESEENAGTPTGAIFPQREDLQQELESIQGEMNSVSVDFGEEETHEPHEESQKFKSAGKIDSILGGPGGGGPDEQAGDEDVESEPQEPEDDQSDQTDVSGSESEEMSREELLRALVESYGSSEEMLNSDEFRSMIRSADYRLKRLGGREESGSHDWV
ncbi:MAG: HIT family protein [Candidatus Nanohaloarchaea archaeon]